MSSSMRTRPKMWMALVLGLSACGDDPAATRDTASAATDVSVVDSTVVADTVADDTVADTSHVAPDSDVTPDTTTIADTMLDTDLDTTTSDVAEDTAETDVDAGDVATTEPVTVMVVDSLGQPRSAATVTFADPDGSVVATVLTDVAGMARAEVAAGGSVTTQLASSATSVRTYSILGVAPGDTLHIGAAPAPSAATLGRITATSAGRFPEADYYTLLAPCVSHATGDPNAQLQSIDVPDDCGGNPVDIVMLATTPATTLLAYRTALDTLVAGDATLDLGGWKSDVLTFTLTLENRIGSEVQAWAGARSNGHRLLTNKARSPSSVTRTMTVPPGLDAYDYRLVAFQGDATSSFVRYLDGALVDTTVDVGAELLPFAALPTLNGRTVSDLVGDASLDGATVTITGVSAGASAEWIIVLPAGTRTFTLPTLPANAVDPLSHTQVFTDAFLFDADAIDGYDAYRTRALTTDARDPFGLLDTMPVGQFGRVRVSHARN